MILITAVVVMVNLGFWQLDRLNDKRELADTLEARAGEPAVPLDASVSYTHLTLPTIHSV